MRATKRVAGPSTRHRPGQGGEAVLPSLKLTQAGLGLFEGVGGAISLGCKARDLFALVSMLVASLLGFLFHCSDCGSFWKIGSSHVLGSTPMSEAIGWV